MVKVDRFGLPMTYFGYILLLISMTGFFFSKYTGFRALLNHPLLKKGTMAFLLLIMMNGVKAEGKSLPEKSAKRFGEVQMLYHDRIVPLQTFAKEFALKLYGKSSYHTYNAEQLLLGWLLYPEIWMHEKIIKVKDKEVRRILDIEGKYASFADFFTDGECYKLEEMLNRIYLGEEPEKMKEILVADEKIQLIFMLQTGSSLTIFPEKENNELIWFSPVDALPEQLSENEKLLIRGYFELLRQYAEEDDLAAIELAIDKLKLFQKKKAGDMLLPPAKIKAERFYNRLNVVKPIVFLNLLLGVFSLLYFFRIQYRTTAHTPKVITGILNIFLILTYILQSIPLHPTS
jgi:flagellar biosynthesis protein FliQ